MQDNYDLWQAKKSAHLIKRAEDSVCCECLVLLPGDIAMFSWSVSVPGKARLAGNGRSPCQEAQRGPGALTDQPFGRSRAARRRRCRGLPRATAIGGARRLAHGPHTNAEHGNITLQEH